MLEACHSTSLPQGQSTPRTFSSQVSRTSMNSTSHSEGSTLQLPSFYDTVLLPFLQSQVGTYSGYLVCRAVSSYHPPVFQDATMKRLSALLPGTLIFVSTTKKKMITIYFFLLATCLPISLKEKMPEVSRRAVNCISLQSHVPLRVSPPTPSPPLPHITHASRKQPDMNRCESGMFG